MSVQDNEVVFGLRSRPACKDYISYRLAISHPMSACSKGHPGHFTVSEIWMLFVPPAMSAPGDHRFFLPRPGAIKKTSLWNGRAGRVCSSDSGRINELRTLQKIYFRRHNSGWTTCFFSKGPKAVCDIFRVSLCRASRLFQIQICLNRT
jgi:hypothetical protein